MSKLSNFVRELMSGADNTTPSIGRYLAVFLFINFLFAVPAVVLIAMVMKDADWEVWEKMFSSLTLYIPAVAGSATALIWGTHKTEPPAAQ